MGLKLDIDDLSLSRGRKRLISGLSTQIVSGEVVCLTGPNGVGKTTLLRAIAGFVRPDHGEITLTGLNTSEYDRSGLIHYCGHHDAFNPGRTAGAELDFIRTYLGPQDQASESLDKAMSQLGLKGLLGLETRLLSAGQKRRLSLARLMVVPRAVWLLDEPMAPLDAHYRSVLRDLIKGHIASGAIAIMAVHDPLDLKVRELALSPPAPSSLKVASDDSYW